MHRSVSAVRHISLAMALSTGLTAWGAGNSGVTVALTGHPLHFHRNHVEVAEVPEAEQADYQSSWNGELGLRVSGLKPGAYRVRLDYTEMDMNEPSTRVFDILINDAVVKREVCVYSLVGNHRVLSYDFTATARDGVITYFQRKSVPLADYPSFTLLRLYDAAGNLVVRRSAYDLRPPDWKLRDELDELYRDPDPNARPAPPWSGTYKIRPDEASRLTPADVVGPDGIVYPNWTHVGIPGGIPALPETMSAADFGMVPGGPDDSSTALQRAIDALQARGGGVLLIPAGRYYLDRPVFVTADNCVLRGAGADRTQFIARFTMRGRAPEFHDVAPGGKIGPSALLTLWVDPTGLTGLTLSSGTKLIQAIAQPGIWNTVVTFSYAGSLLLQAAGPGPANLKAVATYRNGTVRSASQRVDLVQAEVPQLHSNGGVLGMINFVGAGDASPHHILLAADGKRGAMSLDFPPGHGLKAGDRIHLVAPITTRWRTLLRTSKRIDEFRENEYQIKSVAGNRVLLPEALRIDFPIIDGAYVQKIRPLMRCGIEDLGFEQVVPTNVHSVMFSSGWECWVRGLRVAHTGDKAVYMPLSKRCEVRDCVFERAWCHDGGFAYVGWEDSFDCLMENVTTYDMRHAPVLQWAASGNVIRSSVFHGSDAQWHAGWTNENLYENLVVESSEMTGAYGNGGWASGPDDAAHGPNGPRNVVYNCNFTSPRNGLWLGGMNEGWLILHNRFVAGMGPAVFAKDASFDHIFWDNVFVTLDPEPAAVYLATPDCIGIEFIGNRFYGARGRIFGGAIPPAVNRDNWSEETGGINRPRPAVPSIFEWEQAHRARIDAGR